MHRVPDGSLRVWQFEDLKASCIWHAAQVTSLDFVDQETPLAVAQIAPELCSGASATSQGTRDGRFLLLATFSIAGGAPIHS